MTMTMMTPRNTVVMMMTRMMRMMTMMTVIMPHHLVNKAFLTRSQDYHLSSSSQDSQES